MVVLKLAMLLVESTGDVVWKTRVSAAEIAELRLWGVNFIVTTTMQQPRATSDAVRHAGASLA